MITVATLRAAGFSAEEIVRVLEIEQTERRLARREQNRINKQNQRARQRVSTVSADTPSPPSLKEKVPLHPLKENNPSTPPLSLSSDSDGCAFARRPSLDLFEEFWREYPKRDGANPRKPAERKFLAIVRSGTPAENVITGARRYRKQLEGKNQVGTIYVAQAQTWLNQQRWVDEQQGTLPLLSVVPRGPSALDLELIAEYRRNHGGAHG